MIDPKAQAALDDALAGLSRAENAARDLLALVPQLPDPPPPPPTAYIADVPTNAALIEEGGRAYIAIDLVGDALADRDLTFRATPLFETATADDIAVPESAVLKAATGVVMFPVDLIDDDLVEPVETLRIRFTCDDPHVTFLNDTVLITITDSDVKEPAPGVTFHKRQINAYQELCLTTWFKGWERYDRYITRHVIEPGKPIKCQLAHDNRASGGVALKLPGAQYGILLDGVEVYRVKSFRWDGWADVTLAVENIPPSFKDGPLQLDLKQYDAAGNEVPLQGTFVPSFVYLNREGKLKDAPWFPVYSSSYDVARSGFVFCWAKIPRHYIFNEDGSWKEPYTYALAPEPEPQEWTAPIPATDFTAIQLNPYLKDDHYIMTRDHTGSPSFESAHVYDMSGGQTDRSDVWIHPSVDGPRGKGRVINPFDAQPSRLGGGHFLDHMSFGHCHADGLVQRHFGYVVDWPYPQWQEKDLIKSSKRLIGNWDAVPEEKRGLDRSWTWYWDPRTVKRGTGSPIVNDGHNSAGLLEPPHDGAGPTVLVPRPQPQHNDLLEAVYDPRSHLTPPKMRIGIEGLRSPWGVTVTDDGLVLITEQSASVVSAYQRSLDGTYTKLWELGGIPIPQGIDHDGQGNVYVGSRANFGVYRFNLADRVITKFAQNAITGKSFFCSVHVNRDPKTGGIYICSSTANEAANFGNPQTWRPDGTGVNLFPYGAAPHGLAGGDSATYSTPARTGWRVLMRGGSDIGLMKWRRKRAGDVDFGMVGRWDSSGFHRQFHEDAGKWWAEGFHLVYGRRAHPSFRIELPHGYADWCDRYIKVCHWGE
jgi:hypothetical protein